MIALLAIKSDGTPQADGSLSAATYYFLVAVPKNVRSGALRVGWDAAFAGTWTVEGSSHPSATVASTTGGHWEAVTAVPAEVVVAGSVGGKHWPLTGLDYDLVRIKCVCTTPGVVSVGWTPKVS